MATPREIVFSRLRGIGSSERRVAAVGRIALQPMPARPFAD
jgi:hypothetical protein